MHLFLVNWLLIYSNTILNWIKRIHQNMFWVHVCNLAHFFNYFNYWFRDLLFLHLHSNLIMSKNSGYITRLFLELEYLIFFKACKMQIKNVLEYIFNWNYISKFFFKKYSKTWIWIYYNFGITKWNPPIADVGNK